MTALEQRTLGRMIAAQAERHGERPFLTFGEETVGYAGFAARVREAAAGLQACGLVKGDKLALLMGNHPDYLALWFGAAHIGAIEVPLNTAHRGALLVYMLDLADCAAIAIDAALWPVLAEVIDQLPKLRQVLVAGTPPAARLGHALCRPLAEVLRGHGEPRPVAVSGADPYAIMFTSGTTGPSKGALMPHNYALVMGEIIAEGTAYGEADCLFNLLPLFHGNAQVLSTVPALLAGSRMVLGEKFSASRFWDEVRRHGCTEFNYIGTILAMLMKADPSPKDRDHPLRLMMGAGAGPGLCQAFEARFGVPLVEGYGMTEIGIPLMSRLGRRRPGCCGTTGRRYAVRVVDEHGADVADERPGELWVRPRTPFSMMLEYYKMPEPTAEAWRDGWFRTGDYLVREADGFFRFVDRKKDALRRRGENISSFEVERVVLDHPAVLECAVIPGPSDLGEDEVMVCVVPRPGGGFDPSALIAHCRANMASFMVPRYVRIMNELPKTPTARVEKFRLRRDGVTADTWDREAAETALAFPAELQALYRLPGSDGGAVRLLASRDPADGDLTFPPRAFAGADLSEAETVAIPAVGRVHAFTVVRGKPPYDLPSPYAVGYVDVEGATLRVFGLFAPELVDVLSIGLPVALDARPLGVDNLGAPCLRPLFEARKDTP